MSEIVKEVQDSSFLSSTLPISGVVNFEEQVNNLRSIASSERSVARVTSGGRKEWIPNCSFDVTPVVGMIFQTLSEGINFYKSYALLAGFNTRKSTKIVTHDVVRIQYCLCNKAGFKDSQQYIDGERGQKVRKRLVTRVGCNARMVLKYVIGDVGGYVVTNFVEGHSHPLYSPNCAKFQKEGRKVNIMHKKFIVDNSKVNVGPSKSFRIMKEYVGGYDNIGASKQDFKNFQRDLKAYIDGSDAQMFVDKFKHKNNIWSAFFYEFEVDEHGCLYRVFWADPLCRRNYNVFGDMVSFDTTFKTNKYNMVFAPFTGVDHHRGCVTFAAALIAKEDISSFEWVFRTFIKAMCGNEPTCLITDQDPAMKVAVENVFKKTKHRFCMWHIMKKMPEKLGRAIIQDSKFLEDICSIVWSEEIEPEEFEMKWNKIILDYGLCGHEWLRHMYEIRKLWIPSYFRDLFLWGIMRTTSRSESENNFFTSFTNPHLSLVEFYMRFESSMECQRHNQSKKDNDSQHMHPETITPLEIEKHGTDIYTISMFYIFQEELEIACFSCGLVNFVKENGLEIFGLSHGNRKKIFQVVFDASNHETRCSCKLFERQGVPCSHMLWVWNSKRVVRIPEQYVLPRWCKFAVKRFSRDIPYDILECCDSMVEKKRMLSTLWCEVNACVSLAQGDEAHLLEFIKTLQNFRYNLESHVASNKGVDVSSKTNDIEVLIGAKAPSEVCIKPPKVSKNKGTGVHIKNASKDKRLKTDKEKVTEKRKRLCRGCNQLSYHDIRNCPNKDEL